MPTELMRMHPDCPNPGISDDVSLTAWNLQHKAKKPRASFSHIPKKQWEQIFGKRNERGK